MRRMLFALLLSAVSAAASTAQTPAPQTPALPEYEVKWMIDTGEVYSGTLTMAIDAKGVVSGKLNLTVPTAVTGPVSGVVKDGVWTFKSTYTVVEQACSGTVEGTGKGPVDRKVITGTATIQGCSETPLTSTFTFTRLEKK